MVCAFPNCLLGCRILSDESCFCSRIPTINCVLSGSILFNGLMAEPTLRFLSTVNIAAPTQRTYMNVQKDYLNGVSVDKLSSLLNAKSIYQQK